MPTKVEGKVNEFFVSEEEQRTNSTAKNISVKWTGRDPIRVAGVGDFAAGQERTDISPEQLSIIEGVGSDDFVIDKKKEKSEKASDKEVKKIGG